VKTCGVPHCNTQTGKPKKPLLASKIYTSEANNASGYKGFIQLSDLYDRARIA
jgi:hypothetical protein